MTSALHYGVRLSVIGRLLGQLLLLYAAFTLVPTIFCLCGGEMAMALTLLRGAVIAALLGGLLHKIKKPVYIQRNEILCVAGLSFLATALLSSSTFSANGISFVDAFFEAVSGVTTTGLSTVQDMHERSPGMLFFRAWLQWYGGLGIVAFAVGISLNPQVLARRVTSDSAAERDAIGGTRPHYRRIIIVYVSLTVAGCLLIAACGASWFNALALSLSAVSTGGFSPLRGSLAVLPNAAATACLVVSLAASLPLVYYHLLARNRWQSIAREPQWKMMVVLLLFMSSLMTILLLQSGMGISKAIWEAGTMISSAQSTAGFSTVKPESLPDSGKILLITAMFLGGAAGSTAGGTKLLRWIILLRVVYATIRKSLTPPHAVTEAKLGNSIIESEELKEAAAIIVLFAGSVLAAWFAFTWIGHDPLNSLFEVVSATNTVGLSVGICRPELETSHKIFLCFAMLMGRVEVVAWLVILWPPTWMAKRRTWQKPGDVCGVDSTKRTSK